MNRPYYLLKVAAIILAIGFAAWTGQASTAHLSHAVTLARYSASAQVEAAAWHTTAYLARGVAHLVGLCSILQP